MADEIVKKESTPQGPSKISKLGATKATPSGNGLHARIQAAKTKPKVAFEPAFNRIKLLLDASGSMGSPAEQGIQRYGAFGSSYGTNVKTKMDYLHEAVAEFLKNCSWYDTEVGFVTFGYTRPDYKCDYNYNGVYKPGEAELNVPLTCDPKVIESAIAPVSAHGGTPMTESMQLAIANENVELINRAIIISDGCANDPASAEATAHAYANLGVPVDCVHIGPDVAGEDLLHRIAEITGGIYLKFTDVSKFGESFKYLTPKLRKQLSLPGMAKLIGASEVKS